MQRTTRPAADGAPARISAHLSRVDTDRELPDYISRVPRGARDVFRFVSNCNFVNARRRSALDSSMKLIFY